VCQNWRNENDAVALQNDSIRVKNDLIREFLKMLPTIQDEKLKVDAIFKLVNQSMEIADKLTILRLTSEGGVSFSERLNTAIRTLKKNAENILRFVDLFKKHPSLPKKCRASTELYNVRFKNPFKAGNNLVKKERLMFRLRAQLHGNVAWQMVETTTI
jgi:hypothetical protein